MVKKILNNVVYEGLKIVFKAFKDVVDQVEPMCQGVRVPCS